MMMMMMVVVVMMMMMVVMMITGPAAAGEDLTRSWYENLPRVSHKSFVQACLEHGSARSSCKDLLEKNLAGSPQEPKQTVEVKRPQAKSWRTPRAKLRACAVEMHMDISQESFANLQEKCGPRNGTTVLGEPAHSQRRQWQKNCSSAGHWSEKVYAMGNQCRLMRLIAHRKSLELELIKEQTRKAAGHDVHETWSQY